MSGSNNKPGSESGLLSGIGSDKTRLEVQLGVTAFAAAYLYVWAFEGILGLNLKFEPFDLFLKAPLISLAAFPLVFYAYVKADPLQRSRLRWRSVRFYQSEFPSLYIRERCGRCMFKTTCRNFISPDSSDHNTYLLRDLWRPHFRTQYPDEFKNTFRRGYTCKLVFGTEVLAITFFVLGLIAESASLLTQFIRARMSCAPFHISVPVPHIMFLGGCLLIWFAISRLNVSDFANPTGCWQAWREINRGHVLWLKQNEPLLVNVVCHAGNNPTTFQED